MNILARTGPARWCSVCGRSWQHHVIWPAYTWMTETESAPCHDSYWTTSGRAKRIRQYNNLAARLYVEAAKERP